MTSGNVNHFYLKKVAAHGDMSRRWGEALRYFKKHSYRGVPLYATTMWHVKSFFHILAIFFNLNLVVIQIVRIIWLYQSLRLLAFRWPIDRSGIPPLYSPDRTSRFNRSVNPDLYGNL